MRSVGGRAVCGWQVHLLWLRGTVWRAVAGGPAEGVACPVGHGLGLRIPGSEGEEGLGQSPWTLGVRKAWVKEGQAL